MIRIPLTQSGPADQFAKDVQAHIEALTAHMMGKPGRPAPRSSTLIESLVKRVPQEGEVNSRGPDSFVAAPYEIFDDTPVEHMPTLDEKKAMLGNELEAAAFKARSDVLSPARARLLEMDVQDILAVAEADWSDDQKKRMAEWHEYHSAMRVIERKTLAKQVEIEELTDDNVDEFRVGSL